MGGVGRGDGGRCGINPSFRSFPSFVVRALRPGGLGLLAIGMSGYLPFGGVVLGRGAGGVAGTIPRVSLSPSCWAVACRGVLSAVFISLIVG